jgi:hypothetical protein
LSPLRFCVALLCATGIAAAAVAAGDPGVTGYQEGKGAGPIQGAAGPNGRAGDGGLEHCDKPMAAVNNGEELVVIGAERNACMHAQGSDASGWVKKVLMMLH